MERYSMVLLDIDYLTVDEMPVIRLFGKDKSGNEPIIAYDSSFRPYIYAIPTDTERCLDDLAELGLEKLEVTERGDLGKPVEVIRIEFRHPQEVPKLRDRIRNLESVADIREHDIPFYRRYLIDRSIVPMSGIEFNGVEVDSAPSVTSDDVRIIEITDGIETSDSGFPQLDILSFDIEVRNPHGMPDPENDEIVMVGIAGNMGVESVISTRGEHLDFVEMVDDEAAILERFAEIVREKKPDILVGYNSDNFDFPYLSRRAEILGVELDLGWDGSRIKTMRRGFANATAIKGTVHVDLYPVMRRYMNLDRYTLERVYQELFGEEKLDLPGDKLWEYWDREELRDELFRYSLDDVVATYRIAEKILPLNMELTRIVGQPLFDISRMATGQQAEWFLVRKAYQYGELVPNKPSHSEFSKRRGRRAVGGYVKEPERGLHENIVQFDFRSLYPSIIISKNISPDTLTDEKDCDCHVAPEYGYRFRKEPAGFVPSVIGEILSERVRIKGEMKRSDDPMERKILNVQQEALKRLANTMYGVYGYSRFRWYSMECAEAITAWGRDYIKRTIKIAEEFGFHTVYADTDGFYATYTGRSS